MKFNKWTVGLAAVGAVSLASVAQAEEKASSVMTAVSSTTLSGYVDTSVNWNIGTGNFRPPGYAFNGGTSASSFTVPGGNVPSKQDGFNLDAIDIKISKSLDESEWAAGYMIDLLMGPDGTSLGTGGALFSSGQSTPFNSIKQAYVNLRTPVGNGLDWKLGVFDNIIGYESTESPNNPNFSRSYGYTLEPTTLTGILASYKFSELISASAGISDSLNPIINSRSNPPKAESYKAYVASVALTAPNDWGFVSGSSLYLGLNNGQIAGGTATYFYAGATLNTPVTGLKTGVSYDHAKYRPIGAPNSWADAVAVYASFQATEKLSLHGRGEYMWQNRETGPITGPNEVIAFTGTVQYDLWKNVLSRVEFRWDHQAGENTLTSGIPLSAGYYNSTTAGGNGKHDSFTLVANAVYKF